MISLDKAGGLITFITLSLIAIMEHHMHRLIGFLERLTMELLNGRN